LKKSKILFALTSSPESCEFGRKFHLYLNQKGIEYGFKNSFSGEKAALLVNKERFQIVIIDKALPEFRILKGTLNVIQNEEDLKAGAGSIIEIDFRQSFLEKMRLQKLVIYLYIKLTFFKLKRKM